jgi:N-acetylglucosamine kinase-like BadF-type ATPase
MVLAVDGGNSKTDVALVAEDGRLLAAVRGPTSSHQQVGADGGMDRLAALVAAAHAQAGAGGGPGVDVPERADVGVYCLAGADTPADIRMLTRRLASRAFAHLDLLRNDTFAALRVGTDRGWGVVVICGQGVNAAGVAPDGRTARLDALGDISGDWGGATDVGWEGLAAAVRARDGRGRRTTLERSVPAHFGLASPHAVTMALYDGRLDHRRIGELSPVVFAAAMDGDAAARAIVDRLADEIVTMAGAMLRRLRLMRLDPEIVLGGGVFRTPDVEFRSRIEAGVQEVAPRARLVRSDTPPVAGAALLGLDALGGRLAGADIGATVRSALAAWDAAAVRSSVPDG